MSDAVSGKAIVKALNGKADVHEAVGNISAAGELRAWAARIVRGDFSITSPAEGEWKAISEVMQRENAQLHDKIRRLRAALEAIVSEPVKLGFFMEWIDKAKKISFEALSTTTEPAGAQRCMELPLADEAERQSGWTLSPRYLDEIQNKIEGYEDCPSWEGIQLVLLAHYGLPLPKVGEEGVESDA